MSVNKTYFEKLIDELTQVDKSRGKRVLDSQTFTLIPLGGTDDNGITMNIFKAIGDNGSVDETVSTAIAYTKDGKLHRDDNQPAVCFHNGKNYYLYNGYLHCDDDKPAWTSNDNRLLYCRNGYIHRDGDNPAYIDPHQGQIYVKMGYIHRDGDKPAIIKTNGYVSYWKNGTIHRDGDQPAEIYPNGDKIYRKNGKLCRDNKQPVIVYGNGDVAYDEDKSIHIMCVDGTHKFYNDKGDLHSIGDKPALIDGKDGSQHWYYNGMRHRCGGKPAIIYSNGSKMYYEFGHLKKIKTLLNYFQ